MRTHTMVAALTAAAVVALAAPAEAKHIRFMGPHPIAARLGGGYCYIETPHLHAYLPDHAALYQQVPSAEGEQYVFTGDPTPFGYDGARHTFYGHHPVVVAGGEPVYCLLDGPHFHAFAPPEGPQFVVKGDVAFYVGAPLPVRPARVRLVNAEYRPFVDLRPVVTVQPPPEWRADVVVEPPSPSVAFVAPSVSVSVPPPPQVIFAPPRVVVPRPRVVVEAPGFYLGAPGVEVRGEVRHREYGDDDDEHEHRGEHHDNGKHKGWFKHERGD